MSHPLSFVKALFRSALLFAAGAAIVTLFALPASAQVSVTATNGTTYTTSGLSSATTNGAQMNGMLVTANFVGGTSQTVTWAALTSTTGGVTGTGWYLSNTGSTTYADGGWNLGNTSALGITSLVINGAPGNTIFDRTFGGATGTPGSDIGKDFAVTSGLGSYAIQAEYSNLLRVGTATPVGDLYTTMTIRFTSPAAGFTSGSTLHFSADTDNAAAGASITAVPEASTFALVGTLISLAGGVAIIRSRRAK